MRRRVERRLAAAGQLDAVAQRRSLVRAYFGFSGQQRILHVQFGVQSVEPRVQSTFKALRNKRKMCMGETRKFAQTSPC